MARNRMAGNHPSYDKKGMTPDQIENKKNYDSNYQKTRKRVKYRVKLNWINRKLRKLGKSRVGDGKDVSHTKGGGTVLEDASNNRSRNGHGKNRSRLK